MVVLVTGSSRGIGAQTIKEFACHGYDVVINYNSSEKEALELQKEIKKYNVRSLVIKADISKEDEVKSMIDKVIKEFNTIDILINNASIALDSTLEDKTIDDFKKVLDVNLVGTFITSKLVGNIMYNNKKGTILNITSNNAIDCGYIESVDYDASKAGVIALTHDFASHLAPYVRVNALALGWVDTDMNKNLSEDFKRDEENKILLNRFASKAEIAKSIYSISQLTYINNEVIRIDGGIK